MTTAPTCYACGRSDGTHDADEHVAYRESDGVRCNYCGRWADWESVFFPRIKMSLSKQVLRDGVWCIEEEPFAEQGSGGICRRCNAAPD